MTVMPTSAAVSQRIKTFNAFIAPERVQVKHAVMAENPYRFFRGTCHLFYEDLCRQKIFPHATPHVWGCGDLHLENFGSYKGRNGYVYFDQNDFDEAMLLPATWEVVRMVTGIVVAFRALNVTEEKLRAWARLFVTAYCKRLVSGKAKHIEARLAKGIVREFLERADRRTDKELLRKLTAKSKNRFALFTNEEHGLEDDKKSLLLSCLNHWLPAAPGKVLCGYKAIDAGERTAGTGSIGVKRYRVLLQDTSDKNNLLLLDVKEAKPSALGPYNPVPQRQWASEAERVVAIQSRSQYAVTAQLNAIEFNGASYTVQELQPEEDKLDFTVVVRHDKDALRVIKDMAMLTASAQLRSAGRQGSAIADELITFANDAVWQEQVMQYAVDYAEQVNADYNAFLRDYRSGFFKQPG